MRSIGWFFLICFFFFSCKKEVEDPMDLGYRYYPTSLKQYYVYQIDSIYVDCKFGVRDTFQFETLEIYDTLFQDALGREAIRIEVYKRNLGTSDWGIPRIYHTNIFSTRAERTEENIRVVKLIFPIVEGAEWNMNDFNFLDEKMAVLKNIHQSFVSNNVQYDSTATSLLRDEENLLDKNYEIEVYALDIGLIYQEKTNIRGISVVGQANDCSQYLPYQPWTAVPIMERIAEGSVVTKKLIDYGVHYQ